MAGPTGNFWVVYDRLPEIIAGIHRTTAQLVRKAAFDIQAHAMSDPPIDTGFLKNSIYVMTHDQSSYDASEGPNGQVPLPEIERPPDDLTAYVAVGAEYGIYQEYGTSTMPAHPYLTPAADFVRPEFEAAMARIEESLARLFP